MPVTVGTLQAILSLKDEVSDKYAKIETRLKNIEDRQKTTSKVVKNENDKISESYRKVAASLDPVVANTQKYEKAEKALNAALKAGIITQDEHNKRLNQAKEKYTGINTSTLTWRQEINKLTASLGSLGHPITSLASVTDDLAIAFKTVKENAGKFVALAIEALPLIAAIGIAFVGWKVAQISFDFLKDAVSSGLETQRVIELLNNTLKSTGSYSEMSADQLIKLAESYELLTGRQKEEIIAAENVLVRFESLNKDSLPKAIEATLAFAKATGKDAVSAAKGLGPALEGSIRSLGALKDEGIVFTTSQRKTLQSLIDTGKVTEYQALLFDILKEKIGTVSNEFDKNLTRQVDRAKIVLDELGEGIASEVIPALEDVFQSLVDQLGGWENLQKTVTNVGHVIGNVIREMVYGVAIGYHQWQQDTSSLVASISGGFKAIVEVINETAHGLASIPGPMQGAFSALAARTDVGLINISKSQKDAKESANAHRIEILKLSKSLVEHRLALEGDTKVYKANENAIDNVIGKAKDETKTRERLTKILKEQLEQSRYLNELEQLAKQGPTDIYTRLKAEQKINDEHEYRLSILRNEETFTSKIAKDLADQEKVLKELNRKVQLDLKTSVRLDPINLTPEITKELDRIMKETEDHLKFDRDQFAEIEAQRNQWLDDLATGWIEGLKTARERTQEQIAAIKVALKEGFFGSDEVEAAKTAANAIATIQSEALNDQLSGWSGFMSDLGNLVGGGFGRILNQISNAIQTFQAGQSVGNQLGKLTGASVGTTAALGYVFGTAAVFKMIYDEVSAHIKREKAQRYGNAAEFSLVGSNAGYSAIEKEGFKLVNAIKDVVKSFGDALGGVVTDIAKIGVRIRNDGKYVAAYIKGEMIGHFESVDDAIRAALEQIVTSGQFSISGISDLVRTGLKDYTSPDFDSLMSFLTSLREISELSWSDNARQVAATTNHLHDLMLELLKVNTITPDVIQGWEDIGNSLVSTFANWRRSITGEEMSPAERNRLIEAESKLFNARKQLEIVRLEQELASYEANKKLVGANGETLRRFFNIRSAELEGYAAFVQARGQLAQSELQVYDATTDAIKDALQATIDALKEIPDINIGDLGRGGRGNRGGGGNNDKDSVKDFISNRNFELSLIGLTGYKRSLRELDKQYDDLIAQAGRDKKLKDELLALKERELALLREEEKKRVANDVKDFVLPTSEFRSIRETAKGLIDEINNSPFGDKRKAESIGLVLNKLNEEITRLSRESAKGLLSDMINDFEKFGLDNIQLTEMRKASAILEHMLSVENYRIRIETLRAEGTVSAEILAMLDKSFAIISGVDISKWFDASNIQSYQTANDNLAETTNKVDDALNDLAESFKNAKDDIKSLLIDIRGGELGIVSPMKSFDFVQNRYRDIINRAKSGDIVSYQESTEVTRDYIEALKKYKPSLAARELPNIERDLQSLLAMNQIHDDNVTYSEKFANNQAANNTITSNGFNNLSSLSNQQLDMQSQMVDKLASINNSLNAQAQRLSQLESLALGNKR